MATISGSPADQLDLAALALGRAREDARFRGGRARARTTRPARRRPTNGAPVLFQQILVELSARTAHWPSSQLAVAALWNERFPDIARHVSVARVDKRAQALFVIADSTAWATQLRLIAPMLMSRFNEALQHTGLGPLHHLHVTKSSDQYALRRPEPAGRSTPAHPAQEPPSVLGFPARRPLSAPDPVIVGAYARQLRAVQQEGAIPSREGTPTTSVHARALLRARTQKIRPADSLAAHRVAGQNTGGSGQASPELEGPA
ncbi:DciA family protein [Streptomyces sp. NBC_01685]|uniref:DciA family protein n=1 Tax=Streptomyces sp. NBC_01685 TaxID=2975910 RepID=UPI003FCD1E45